MAWWKPVRVQVVPPLPPMPTPPPPTSEEPDYPPLPPGADDQDTVPAMGFTRAGYVILYHGQFSFDAGDVERAHAYMDALRTIEPEPPPTGPVRPV